MTEIGREEENETECMTTIGGELRLKENNHVVEVQLEEVRKSITHSVTEATDTAQEAIRDMETYEDMESITDIG